MRFDQTGYRIPTDARGAIVSEYADHDPIELEPYYTRHVQAMTAERLHEKGDIAVQLAYRDVRIARLTRERDELAGEVERLREALHMIADKFGGVPPHVRGFARGCIETLPYFDAWEAAGIAKPDDGTAKGTHP